MNLHLHHIKKKDNPYWELSVSLKDDVLTHIIYNENIIAIIKDIIYFYPSYFIYKNWGDEETSVSGISYYLKNSTYNAQLHKELINLVCQIEHLYSDHEELYPVC